MRKSISLGLAIAFSFFSISRSKANPAVLAPAALCAGTAGVGCVVIGVTVIGGVTFYVWKHPNGKTVRADRQGNVQPLKSEGGIDAVEAAKRGDAHYILSNNPQECYKIAKRHGRTLKEHPRAKGGGLHCIFHGEQKPLGSSN